MYRWWHHSTPVGDSIVGVAAGLGTCATYESLFHTAERGQTTSSFCTDLLLRSALDFHGQLGLFFLYLVLFELSACAHCWLLAASASSCLGHSHDSCGVITVASRWTVTVQRCPFMGEAVAGPSTLLLIIFHMQLNISLFKLQLQ